MSLGAGKSKGTKQDSHTRPPEEEEEEEEERIMALAIITLFKNCKF